MPDSDQMFLAAEHKYLEGKRLDSKELDCMHGALASIEPRTASIACGAILRDPNARAEQKDDARLALKRLCTTLNAESERSELSITLMLIPFGEINYNFVKEFIYDLLSSSRFTLRANAIVLLERLATHGDQRAFTLIRVANTDVSEVVRGNASDTLKRLENSRSQG